MARRMQINRLDKDELTYELTVRGIAPGNVEEMRSRLAIAKQMEKAGDSLTYPKYPYMFKQDADEVGTKLAELETLVDSFSEGSRSGNFVKLQSKLAHVLGRIENMEAQDDDEVKERSILLAQTLSLMDKLNRKCDDYDDRQQQSVPPSLLVLQGTSSQPGASTQTPGAAPPAPLSRSSSVGSPQNPQLTLSSSSVKPILPHKWNLKFSGDKKSLSVTAFFERVDELRKARNVSKDILLESGIDLFEGRAYEFYQVCRSEVNSWDMLVQMFKEEYQPAFYSEKLLEEIKRRTQGPDETIGTYLAVMSKYFQRLQCPISEEAKLIILLRNLSPMYRSQLGPIEVTTIAQLRTLCKRIEQRMQSSELYTPPPRKGQSLEPDLAYVGLEDQVEEVRISSTGPKVSGNQKKPGEIICFKCNKPGHRAVGCAEQKKICFKCKKEGYTIRTCPSCSGNANRRS